MAPWVYGFSRLLQDKVIQKSLKDSFKKLEKLLSLSSLGLIILLTLHL